MIWRRFYFHGFHNLSQSPRMFTMEMMQPEGREEHGKKIPKCCAKWEKATSKAHGELHPWQALLHPPSRARRTGDIPSILNNEPPDSLISLFSLISFKIIFSQKIREGNRGVALQHAPRAHKTFAEAPVLISDREEITQRILTITTVTWSFE